MCSLGTVRAMPTEQSVSRHLPMEAVHNFRDLGGYPTRDGRVTNWRRLFRSDALYRASDTDLAQLIELEIRTVVDLRTHDELAKRGSYPTERHPVRLEHVPLLERIWQHTTPATEADSAVPYLVERYMEMLANGAMIASAIEILADPAAMPAVFHCAAGKDRTGVIAMLVLSVVGVDDDVIAADYALTEEGMVRIRAYFEAHPELYGNVMENPAPAYLASPAEVMHQVLARVRDEHGSVENLLNAIGVTDATLARLRSAMLD